MRTDRFTGAWSVSRPYTQPGWTKRGSGPELQGGTRTGVRYRLVIVDGNHAVQTDPVRNAVTACLRPGGTLRPGRSSKGMKMALSAFPRRRLPFG